jgi:hypothetical protein
MGVMEALGQTPVNGAGEEGNSPQPIPAPMEPAPSPASPTRPPRQHRHASSPAAAGAARSQQAPVKVQVWDFDPAHPALAAAHYLRTADQNEALKRVAARREAEEARLAAKQQAGHLAPEGGLARQRPASAGALRHSAARRADQVGRLGPVRPGLLGCWLLRFSRLPFPRKSRSAGALTDHHVVASRLPTPSNAGFSPRHLAARTPAAGTRGRGGRRRCGRPSRRASALAPARCWVGGAPGHRFSAAGGQQWRPPRLYRPPRLGGRPARDDV